MQVPAELLEKVDTSILTPHRLARRLSEGSWIDDYEQTKQLILDLSALFISYNTETYSGDGFIGFYECLDILLMPLINEGFIQTKSVTWYDRKFLCISNSVENCNNVIRNSNETKLFHGVLLHAHCDVVKPKEPLGTFDTYYAPDSENFFGRGSCDMKSQIALLILLLYTLKKRNYNNVTVLISSDEEQASRNQFEYFKRVRGLINIDLEPASLVYGNLANQIDDSRFSIFYFSDELDDKNLEPYIIKNLTDYLKGFEMDFHISLSSDNLCIFVSSLEDPKKILRFNQEPSRRGIIKILSSSNIRVCDTYFNLPEKKFSSTPTSTGLKVLRQSLELGYGKEYVVTYPAITGFKYNSDGSFTLCGNFQSAFTLHAHCKKGNKQEAFNNIFIGSIPDRGRHSRYEMANLTELHGCLKFLEVVCSKTQENMGKLIQEA